MGGVDNFGEIKISEIKAVKDKIDLSGSKRIYYSFVDMNDSNIWDWNIFSKFNPIQAHSSKNRCSTV